MTYRFNKPVRQATNNLKRVIFGFMAVTFMIFAPAAQYVFAEGAGNPTSSTDPSCTPVQPTPGIQQPTGTDASTYTFDSCTGLWVNPYYTWSPATKVATPITPFVYSCNTLTWQWTTLKWEYSPVSNSWYQQLFTFSQLPTDGVIASDSLIVCAPPPPPVSNTSPTTSDPSSSSSTDTSNTTINSTNNASINNSLNSTASSGDANVIGNTTGGNALSGNAAAEANVLNSLQSSTSAPIATFVANINGNMQGNLIVDPSQLQPANQTLDSTNNLTVNTQNNGQINNTLVLNANTGNATVADNTTGGNATSGNADAIANVVNMIDSVISSGKSFVGVININGNLTGDILMPQNFLNSLIASNAPSTTVNISNSVANSLGINTTNNQTINNNVNSSATSGNANVNGNTSAGSATTGNTSTAVTIFNLTGSQIIGSNALLVFVNVPGTWLGVIMNAPGATAAALGSDISQNTTNNATFNTTNNQAINNNVDLAASSGDATVAHNTTGGNATSGNAETAVNFLNLNNTQFSLTGWFGILFINVFGTWIGNFGVIPPPVTTSPTTADPSSTSSQTPPTAPKVFSFEPTSGNVTGSSTGSTLNAQLISKKSTLGSTVTAPLHTPAVATVAPVSHTSQIIGGILLAIGLGTLIVEQVVSGRHNQRSHR